MLMHEATPEMVEIWRTTWNEYKDRLLPNRKSGAEIVAYLKDRYSLTEIDDDVWLKIVTDNVLNNEPLSERIPIGTKPLPLAFFINNSGKGKILFENQDEVFRKNNVNKIFVGIDLSTGFFCVEGSSMLWDELYAFQGLDEKDIQNPYCVAEYIACLNRFGLLNKIIDTAR